MARPYTVYFPQSPASFASADLTGSNRKDVIASLQAPIQGQPLVLNQLQPGTIPDVPFNADNPIPAIYGGIGLQQPLPLGSSTVIPGGSRSIVIVCPAGGNTLAGLTFTVSGLDQFGRPLVSAPTVGPAPGAAIEFGALGAALPLPPLNTFNLYYSQVDDISFTGAPIPNTLVWAAIGGYGMTPFVGVDTTRIGWGASVEISGFSAASTSWSYTVYGTNYPIYTPNRTGGWVTVDPTTSRVGKHLISSNVPPAFVANLSTVSPITDVSMTAAVNNAWSHIAAPTSYIWAEIGYIGAPGGAGVLTQPSTFLMSYVQQGA